MSGHFIYTVKKTKHKGGRQNTVINLNDERRKKASSRALKTTNVDNDKQMPDWTE